jgi:hypothetical protein
MITVDGTLIGVVEEEPSDRRPQGEGRRLAQVGLLHDLRPRHNALVDLVPLGVVPHGEDGKPGTREGTYSLRHLTSCSCNSCSHPRPPSSS